MAQAKSIITAMKTGLSEQDQLEMMGEMVMIGLPLPTVRALSDAAKARNMTLAQVLAQAISEYLKKTESRIPDSARRLLTEG